MLQQDEYDDKCCAILSQVISPDTVLDPHPDAAQNIPFVSDDRYIVNETQGRIQRSRIPAQ
jgi:hypothetical protein